MDKREYEKYTNLKKWTETWAHWEQYLRKYRITKHQVMIAYMKSVFQRIQVHPRLSWTFPSNKYWQRAFLKCGKSKTNQIRKETYYLFESHGLFPEKKQKVYRKRTRGTDDIPFIDQYIWRDKKGLNVAMPWIDNKKAYDGVP